jgi:hypothetical protein
MHELLTVIHHAVTMVFHTLDMLYQSLLLIGAIGVAAQAALGFAHGHGGHGHSGADTHGGGLHHAGGAAGYGAHAAAGHAVAHGDGHGQVHAPAQGHHAHGQHGVGNSHHGDGHQDGRAGEGVARLFTLLSPLTVFSFFMGMGLTGLLAQTYLSSLSSILTGLIATAGGVAFYRLLVRPMWGIVLRFASNPAETLRGAVATDAEALSRFDARGRGMVRVTVDGEVKSLLAYLEPEDTSKGIVVSPGDRLVVTGVDEKKNTCRVTRL